MPSYHKSQSFVQGAFILAITGFGVRFLGAGLRIILAAILGDEGIGLYMMAYPVYSSLLAVSTAGIPIAVSKLVAEHMATRNYRAAHRVFRVAFIILLIFGSFFSLLLFFGAGYISELVKDPRAYYQLLSLAPAIFIVAVMSSFRGFFQGRQQMLPTALSQIAEQVGRVVSALVLSFLLLPRGLEYGAAGATFGASFGALMSLLVLLYIYFSRRKYFAREMKIYRNGQEATQAFSTILYRIFTLSLPITFGSLAMPLMNLLDMSIVPARLQQLGFSMERATALYGQLTGFAGSIVHFPTVITVALAMSLVPAVSEAQALKNPRLIRNRLNLAIRFALFLGIPAAGGLLVLAEPICFVLFETPGAGYALAMLSPAVIFLALYITSSGALQGLGRTMIPVKNILMGAAVKLVLTWFLTASFLHVGGAALATVSGFFLAAFLNLLQLSRVTSWRFQWVETALKPLLATVLMSLGVSLIYRYSFYYGLQWWQLSERLVAAGALVLAIFAGIILFVVALFLSGAVHQEDLQHIPRIGPRVASWAASYNFHKRKK